MPGGDYRDALRERAGWRPGGRAAARRATASGWGSTAGPPAYTVGQRQGLGVALGEPRYVSRIDPLTNTITLGRRAGPRDDARSNSNGPASSPATRPAAGVPFRAEIRIRHRATPIPATVRPASPSEPARGGRWLVETDDPGLGRGARARPPCCTTATSCSAAGASRGRAARGDQTRPRRPRGGLAVVA